MRSGAALALGLLITWGAGLGSGSAAPGPAERKPASAATKVGAPAKVAAGGSKLSPPRPLPRRVPEVSRRPAGPAIVSPPARPAAPAPRTERTGTGTPTATRPSIDARLAAAREVYQAGRYAEVPTALIKLLTESQLTPTQLAAVYELLASAYVALGQTELAIRCFSEVLSRRPSFALDPVRTSPKIRAALDKAQSQGKPASPPAALPATRRPM